MKSFYRVIFTLLLVVGIDALSKFWAEGAFELYQPIPIIGQFFRLTLNYNTGVAFGLFANGGIWPLVVTGLIIVGLAAWLVRALHIDEIPPVASWPIGLILGGAIANFVDRLPDRRVTDLLDVGLESTRWPTFNLADSFIVLGVAILLLMTLLEQRQLKEEA